MRYPLPEKIGAPELFVGRKQELENLEKWLDNIPRRLSKSRVILARRKSGKTALVQRVFNQVWSADGAVIPFYFDVAELKTWYPQFAIKYYTAFASQYISFLERDETPVRTPLTLEQIREYGLENSIQLLVDDVNLLLKEKVEGLHGAMWDAACSAPHRFATVYDQRILVIIDEFQNLNQYIYPDPYFETSPIESMPGSFHSLVESKYAPMLVTGSYIGWLLEISDKYLEAGRLSRRYLPPYLTPEEGLQAVFQYAQVYQEPISNETAVLINELCMSDPFFISCVMQSNYPGRDLTTAEGVLNTVDYEIIDRRSEMSMTWAEYIELTLQRVNDRYAKSMLLYLSKNNERYWSTRELKEILGLDLSLDEIKQRLLLLVKSDLLEWGPSDIQFRGLQDGTLNVILRNRFEEEIDGFMPNMKEVFQQQIAELQANKRRLQGALNNLAGQLAERQLALEFRSRKRLALADLFEGGGEAARSRLNVIDVRERFIFQRPDGKPVEIDVRAEADDGRVVLVEVKKTQAKTGAQVVQDFCDKLIAYAANFSEQNVLPAFLSLGGFTDEALALCRERDIATADHIAYG